MRLLIKPFSVKKAHTKNTKVMFVSCYFYKIINFTCDYKLLQTIANNYQKPYLNSCNTADTTPSILNFVVSIIMASSAGFNGDTALLVSL